MIEMKPFARHDWYGFAGAERFADGSEPLIGSATVVSEGTEFGAIVVLDAVGLFVEVICDEGNRLAYVVFEGSYAARSLAMLGKRVEWPVLRAMPGAEVLDHEVPKGREDELVCVECEHGSHYGMPDDGVPAFPTVSTLAAH